MLNTMSYRLVFANHKDLVILISWVLMTIASFSVRADIQQHYSHRMIEAIYSDDREGFEKYLQLGADPTTVFESPYYAESWIICEASRNESEVFLKLIASHGWDLHHRKLQWASNEGYSSHETALYCSVINRSAEPFKYLVESGADITTPLCGLCTAELSKENLLEYILLFNQHEKALWLLENTEAGPRLVTKKAISSLENNPVTQKTRPWYWKTVDALRALGHEVNPRTERDTE